MSDRKIRVWFHEGLWYATLRGYRHTGTGATASAACDAFKAACIGVHSQVQ